MPVLEFINYKFVTIGLIDINLLQSMKLIMEKAVLVTGRSYHVEYIVCM